ncbi:MAG: hypothetical protein CM1200mP41_17460 [Gammaproteobacteria bacterium]|nr:MAG: hypothetical protein CM1200mP41_17460 [Gammaproteobacteria bacterium]
MNRSKRNFIKYGIYIGGNPIAGTAAWVRGVRYPGLQFEPVDIQTAHRVNDAVWRSDMPFPSRSDPLSQPGGPTVRNPK